MERAMAQICADVALNLLALFLRKKHMSYLKFALIGAVLLSGCAIPRVKFDDANPPQESRIRNIGAEQKICEVEGQLALFTDENKNLWLNCPYRYQGRTVQALSYIGPKPHKGTTDFVYDDASQKMKSLHKEPLKGCGTKRYCADLDQYGYLDFSIKIADTKARINYLDVSNGLMDIEHFYENLDGSVPLDKQLVRLVNTTRVVDRVERLGTLTQVRSAQEQLEKLGLTDRTPIRSALASKRTELEIADLRQQNNFEGYQAAFRLGGDRSDLEFMQKLAETDEQKSSVFAALIQEYNKSHSAETLQTAAKFASRPNERTELDGLLKVVEQEKQAELRRQEEARLAEAHRQEEARLADVRRQDEARLAEQRAQQARAEEERCMRNAACRQEVEKRRAACVEKIQRCREGCDRAVGSGTYGSFFANLTAAGMARACYAGCKCDSGFGDLVTKFNNATDGTSAAAVSTTAKSQAAKPRVFECKIFCKSASGPAIFRRIDAATRKEAAKIAGDHANEFCEKEGKSFASAVVLPESQCQER
jgi:hypothetical protein